MTDSWPLYLPICILVFASFILQNWKFPWFSEHLPSLRIATRSLYLHVVYQLNCLICHLIKTSPKFLTHHRYCWTWSRVLARLESYLVYWDPKIPPSKVGKFTSHYISCIHVLSDLSLQYFIHLENSTGSRLWWLTSGNLPSRNQFDGATFKLVSYMKIQRRDKKNIEKSIADYFVAWIEF